MGERTEEKQAFVKALEKIFDDYLGHGTKWKEINIQRDEDGTLHLVTTVSFANLGKKQ